MNDKERIAELEAQLASASPLLTVKFGNKRNVVVSGPALKQRFPVTLYAPSWLELLKAENVANILKFIEDNKDGLSWDK